MSPIDWVARHVEVLECIQRVALTVSMGLTVIAHLLERAEVDRLYGDGATEDSTNCEDLPEVQENFGWVR